MEELDLPCATKTDEKGKPAPDHHNLLKGYRSKKEFPQIFALKEEAAEVEKEFKDHLKDCRRLLGTLYTRNGNP